MYGNDTVIDEFLHRLQQPSQLYLCDALLHAWKHNSLEVATRIVSAGVSLVVFYLIWEDNAYYKSHFLLVDTRNISPILMALRLGDSKVWTAVWTTKLKMQVNLIDSTSLLQSLLSIFNSGGALDSVAFCQMLELLSNSTVVARLSRKHRNPLTWPDIIMQQVHDAHRRSHLRAWNIVSRKLLTSAYASFTLSQAQEGDPSVACNSYMLGRLERVPDDVLVHVLEYDLIGWPILLDPALIEKLAQRWSSRGLEAWLDRLRIEQASCENQSKSTAHRVRSSTALANIAKEHSHLCSYPSRKGYRELLYRLRDEAVMTSRAQVMDFLACYEFEGELGFTFGVGEQDAKDILAALDITELQVQAVDHFGQSTNRTLSTLTWLRLYRTYGTMLADRVVGRRPRLPAITSSIDGNLTLNFPAGYHTTTPFKQKTQGDTCSFMTDTATGWLVRRCITEAVYSWNFRLRRKRGVPYSAADIWYIKHF